MVPHCRNTGLSNKTTDRWDPWTNLDHRHLFTELGIKRCPNLLNGETSISLWRFKDSRNMLVRPNPFQAHLGSKLRFQAPKEEKSQSAKEPTTFNRPNRIREDSMFWGVPTRSKAYSRPNKRRARTLCFRSSSPQETTCKQTNRRWSASKDKSKSISKGSIRAKLRQR